MKLLWIPFISAIFILTFSLTACGGEECTDIDSNQRFLLPSAQKESGNFSKGKSFHYKHSKGFDFDLTVTEDTIIWKTKSMSVCILGDEEVRTVSLESTYPIISIDMSFYDDALFIDYKKIGFWAYIDSTGNFLDYYGDIEFLDSVTIDNVKYNDVIKMFNDYGYVYYSPKDGLLKLYENGSTYFEISGEDDE